MRIISCLHLTGGRLLRLSVYSILLFLLGCGAQQNSGSNASTGDFPVEELVSGKLTGRGFKLEGYTTTESGSKETNQLYCTYGVVFGEIASLNDVTTQYLSEGEPDNGSVFELRLKNEQDLNIVYREKDLSILGDDIDLSWLKVGGKISFAYIQCAHDKNSSEAAQRFGRAIAPYSTVNFTNENGRQPKAGGIPIRFLSKIEQEKLPKTWFLNGADGGGIMKTTRQVTDQNGVSRIETFTVR